uniref:MFS transporter n=1 Tax=Thermofilum pendens TaxID=2269 RepID=A0A7J3X6H0_THEPE
MRPAASKLLLLLFVGWAVGAMCAGIVSGTLTLIKSELGLTSEEAGRVLSSWLLGMLFGALALGYMADRAGRRLAVLVSMTLMGVFTAASSAAGSWLDLSLYRILAGAGNAGYMVSASVLMSEYAPTSARGKLVALLESAWAFGWLAALILSRVIAPVHGWRPVFLSALAAVAVAALLYLTLPESLRYLVSKGRVEEARVISELLGVPLPPGEAGRGRVSELLSGPYLRRTVMLWVHWFAIALTYWGIFLWLPDMLYARGLGFAKSLEYAIAIALAQIPGYLSAAYLVEAVGRKPVLAAYMLLAGLASVGVLLAATPADLLLWGALVSFFNLGAWGVTYAYTPELYPTRLRGTGSGWANSFGRVGGMVGPYVAGLMMQLYGDPLAPFTVFAALHLVSAAAVLLLGVETKGRRLEEVSP